ncbi:MAG: hypothetical protein WCG27_01030 [Pseudomonadota bacterium]
MKKLADIRFIFLVFLTYQFIFFPTLSAAENPQIIDVQNIDIQTLQAWIDRRVGDATIPYFSASGAALIHLEKCNLLRQTDKGVMNVYECSKELQEGALLPGSTQQSPLVAPFLVNAHINDNGTLYAPGLNCSLVEVRTMTKTAVLNAPTFKGIGFGGNEGLSFTPSKDLHQVGKVQLKHSGEEAIVHRFIGVARCWMGSISSSQKWRFEFKPYVLFETENNGKKVQYRNWEAIHSNHVLGGADESNSYYQTTTFDRQQDLIRLP